MSRAYGNDSVNHNGSDNNRRDGCCCSARELAESLIEKLGRQGAEAACRSNSWDGVLQELKQLSN
ncbi:MAG: hypothetical protein QNJ92_05185 [Alphaproteobacteria bacterium]|nr:hypothetical protein [Alphaproteobacteria bacterium]